MCGPIFRASAACVSGAECDIGVVHRVEEFRDRRGIVREIGVHLHDEFRIGPGLEDMIKSGDVGRAQAGFRFAAKDFDVPGMLRRQGFGGIGGAVRTIVVHEENPGIRDVFENAGQQRIEVVSLVVGGDDYRDPFGQDGNAFQVEADFAG